MCSMILAHPDADSEPTLALGGGGNQTIEWGTRKKIYTLKRVAA